MSQYAYINCVGGMIVHVQRCKISAYGKNSYRYRITETLASFLAPFFIAHSQNCKSAYLSRFSTRLVLLLRYDEAVSIVDKLPAVSFTSYYCTT